MRAWLLLGLLACEDEPEPVIASDGEFEIPSCDKYAKEPGIQGFCRTIWAPTLGSLVEMEESCSEARAWEGDCRAAWLATQMSTDWGMDQDHHRLLEICGDHEVCALEVLKTRTDQDIGVQINLCHTHANAFAEECVEHSLQRWWRGNTEADKLGTLHSIDSPYTEPVGWWIAALGVCETPPNESPCEGVRSEVLSACSEAASSLKKDPKGCNKMQLDRADPIGVPQDQLEPLPLVIEPPPPEDIPAQPEPGAGNVGTGVAAPDPRTHGHVPNGTPGGGHHPPPQSREP